MDAQERDEYMRSLVFGTSTGHKRKAKQKASKPQQKGQHTDKPLWYLHQWAFELGMVVKDKPICSSYGIRHRGRCLANTGNCYQCEQEVHMANKYPKKSSSDGKDQHLNAKQENFDKATTRARLSMCDDSTKG